MVVLGGTGFGVETVSNLFSSPFPPLFFLLFFNQPRFELQSISEGEGAGIKGASFRVQGKYAYGLLKNESGTHRLVRLSPFNKGNTRETSFAGLEVLPDIDLEDEFDRKFQLDENDLEITTMRSGGAGGQVSVFF